MRRGHFEALQPVCPRCLHGQQREVPLLLAEVEASRGDHVVHGRLLCTAPECQLEFPVIDGVPVVVPDPAAYLAGTFEHVLMRRDLPPGLAGMIGDTVGPSAAYNTARHHLSLYATDHYAGWCGEAGASQVAGTMAAGLALAGEPGGLALDLGCGVGRGAWALAEHSPGLVLGADLSFPMMRLAQTLLIEGRAAWHLRRVGLVYDPAEAVLPQGAGSERVDFWALDAMALPFPPGRFGFVAAINLMDCIPGPTNLVSEMARMLAPGAPGFLTTPYDWSEGATEPANWLGGHSQRGPNAGASGPMLRATLAHFGLIETASRDGLPWKLTVHERSTMHYALEMIAFRRERQD